LPLLGIPGVTPASIDPAYYDDTWQFRPGRRRAWPANPHGIRPKAALPSLAGPVT